jgi:hypothetical protein
MAKVYSRHLKGKTTSAGAANLAFDDTGVASFQDVHLADIKQLCKAKPGFSLEPFGKAPKKAAPAPKPEPKKEEPKPAPKEEPKAEKPSKEKGFSIFAKDDSPAKEEYSKKDKKKSKDKGE